MRVLRPIAAASIMLALTTAPSIGKPKLEASYVLLGPDGTVARAVYTDETDCPSLTIDGAMQKMNVRMAPQTGKKAAFPVLVCELTIPATAKTATLDGKNLPLPPVTDRLTNIAVIGDTGCRLDAGDVKNRDDADYEEDGKFQNCKTKWPFLKLATSVAASKPQLVVHVGDYIYRESPCPHHDKGCKGSPYGDRWDTWSADFFAPATPLLAAAPLLATRGNHEICRRNGLGFMIFLDPRLANGAAPACTEDVIPQFAVTVGGQQFIMLDSSDAPDDCASKDDQTTSKKKKEKKKKKVSACELTKNFAPHCPRAGCSVKDYADQFAAMKPATGAWLVSHRPAWGFKNKGKSLNKTLQLALGHWKGLLPPGFALAAAGHIHIWEALSFADQGAPQFVLGNSGTLLTSAVDRKLKGKETGARVVGDAKTFDKWGFTIFTPGTTSGAWTATSYSVKDNDKFSCSLKQGIVSCP
jgi:hypothetical protein